MIPLHLLLLKGSSTSRYDMQETSAKALYRLLIFPCGTQTAGGQQARCKAKQLLHANAALPVTGVAVHAGISIR